VLGWLTMSHTLAEDRTLSRFDRIMRGIDAARGLIDFTPFTGIVVALDAQVDSGSNGRPAPQVIVHRWPFDGMIGP
jgi:hypothetical protein